MRRVFVFWPEGSRSIALPDAGSLTIGRAPTCDIAVNHESVSRLHAALHVGKEIQVEDLGSSNGTQISGKKLVPRARTLLPPGTLVELGLVTLLVQGTESIAPVDPLTIPTPPRTMPVPVLENSTMDRLDQFVSFVARGRVSVLLMGEPGVGKERMAERIHRATIDARGPLVKVDCAAFSEVALEAAREGTLFLSDIGDLSASAQATLARGLDGLDARVLSATATVDLPARVREGSFRADLYERLNGVSLKIPPLRERAAEIPELVRRLVQDACNREGVPRLIVTELAMADLVSRPWTRNVRELEEVIDRAVAKSEGHKIDIAHVQ